MKIKSKRDLGVQFRDNPHRMVGQDGAFSIPTRAGLLWFFGDTLIGARPADGSLWYPDGKPVGPLDMSGKAGIDRMMNNSGLLSSNRVGPGGVEEFHYILDERGEIKPLIPLEADEDPNRIRVWCLHGVEVEGWIYLYFVKVATVAEGIFPVNFRILGSGLAIGDSRDWEFNRILSQGSDLWWRADQPHFASAVLNPPGDYLYLYGALQGADQVQRSYLARVHKEMIKHRDSYEYLCGLEGVAGDPGPAGAEISRRRRSEGGAIRTPLWSQHVGE
nr:hypothetical protein [bacterium]